MHENANQTAPPAHNRPIQYDEEGIQRVRIFRYSRAIYGLPQARILANKQLQRKLMPD